MQGIWGIGFARGRSAHLNNQEGRGMNDTAAMVGVDGRHAALCLSCREVGERPWGAGPGCTVLCRPECTVPLVTFVFVILPFYFIFLFGLHL